MPEDVILKSSIPEFSRKLAILLKILVHLTACIVYSVQYIYVCVALPKKKLCQLFVAFRVHTVLHWKLPVLH